MTWHGLLQCVAYFAILLLLTKPLGGYMARVYEGKPPGAAKLLQPLERLIYTLCGVREHDEMGWKLYAVAMMMFEAVAVLAVYLIQRVQTYLPLNPTAMGAVAPHLAFNTAVSFATNTNWQSYGGETTMSYFTQMVALTVQNFTSPAVGTTVLVALIRGFVRKQAHTIGNFWVDLVRGIIYIFLPLSVLFSIVLVSQGVPQTFAPAAKATLLQPTTDANNKPVTEQVIALGPVASEIAIKQLGTNGGGFFNVNSAHPFENPTPVSNLLELLAILLIPMALCYTFGRMVGDTRQGWALLAAMTVIFLPLLAVCVSMEQAGNPLLAKLGVDQRPSALQSGGNMEGKEARCGIVSSAFWATACTATSNGSVNSMHDSYTPLGGLVPLLLIQLAEVVYGGVGSGLYGMLLFAIVAVFIAGLMVGRTPEYLGKKLDAYDTKMCSIGILVPGLLVLVGTAIAVVTPAGRAGILNPGPHGFSEVLYGFSSAGNNNGSAFAGLTANSLFYDVALGICIFFARYWIAVPVLALAGSLARKKLVPASAGTLPTHTPLFIGFLVATILLVGVLVFVPALALGPIVEHLMLGA